MIAEIERSLFLSWRIAAIVAVISHHCYQALITRFYALRRQIHRYRQISAEMLLHQFTIHIYLLFTHNGFEIDKRLSICHIPG